MISPYLEIIILRCLVNSIFALSLNLILGYNGQFALGHAGFMLIGAYASGVVTASLGWPLWAGILLAIALTTLAAAVIGYPCLRLRGDYLAIATLGFGEIIRIVAITLPSATFGGPTGMRNVIKLKDFIPTPDNFNGVGNFVATVVFFALTLALAGWAAWSFASYIQRKLSRLRFTRWGVLALLAIVAGVYHKWLWDGLMDKFRFSLSFHQEAFDSKQWTMFLVYGAVVAIVTLLVRNYLRSAAGRAAVAIREDEIAAMNLGLDIFWVKQRNFMFGCALAGLSGGLLAHMEELFRPADFSFLRSVSVLLMVVLGGMGSITGSFIGATVLTVLPEALRFLAQWRMVIFSLLLILFMLFRPGGLMGSKEIGELLRRKFGGGPRGGGDGPPVGTRLAASADAASSVPTVEASGA